MLVGTAAALRRLRGIGGDQLTDIGITPVPPYSWLHTLAGFHVERALLALGVALALQIGVNYANDYSDGIRGTDINRKGPFRLTASKTTAAKNVRTAAFIAFGIAGLFGIILSALTGHWWLILVGIACVLAAWFYTGGKRPYGYIGLGDIFVFIFFGPVATLGTTFTQLGRISLPAILGAIGVGLLACAILMINNIRDIPTDITAGKKTLAVRLGDRRARICYQLYIFVALATSLLFIATPWILIFPLLLIPAIAITGPVRKGAKGKDLIPVLAGTSLIEACYAILISLAFIFVV